MRIVGRVLGVAVVLVVVLAMAGGGYGAWSTVRAMPAHSGELRLPFLDREVTVYRDAFGIPTIVASSTRDLRRAQGFVHAQDRFYQMDVNRLTGAGRLAELFGPEQLEQDRFLRTMGWERVARQELELLEPETVEALQDYADGVNAYLDQRTPTQLGLEYAVLGIQRPGYEPEPWEPAHSLSFLRLMSWDLRGNVDEELERVALADELEPKLLEALYPPYPEDTPVIVGDTGPPPPNLRDMAWDPAQLAALDQVAAGIHAVDRLRGPQPEGVGSNSWVVSGAHTESGWPLLANDPHLDIGMPSIWYANALRCDGADEACEPDVGGFSFAGIPGVVVGHNERVAWGVTNLGPDVMDLYVERTDPDEPTRYELDGDWRDMEVRTETLLAADGSTEELEVRETHRGPVLSGLWGPLDEAPLGAPDDPAPAVSLRWTALEPGRTIEAFLGFNRAGSWEEFRRAAEDYVVPAQNLVYADVDGVIGYQAPGAIPRRTDHDGTVPVPGWESRYDWAEMIPFDELPSISGTDLDWIVTANNPVVGADAPDPLGSDFDHGYRAGRIAELVEAYAADGLTMDDVQWIQGDSWDPSWEVLWPVLQGLDAEDPALQEARQLLAGWDGQLTADSQPAAVHAAVWRHLLLRTFGDRLPERYPPEGGSRWVTIVENLLAEPDHPWWDDPASAEVDDRDAALVAAVGGAMAELEELLGEDTDTWTWGELHQAEFRSSTLGSSGIAPVEALFNRGGYPVSGGSSIVNANGWDASEGYEVTSVASFRLIVEPGRLDATRALHTTGQSGHAFAGHYTDMIRPWADNAQHEPGWTLRTVIRLATDTLILYP